jgi:hypothetical protein
VQLLRPALSPAHDLSRQRSDLAEERRSLMATAVCAYRLRNRKRLSSRTMPSGDDSGYNFADNESLSICSHVWGSSEMPETCSWTELVRLGLELRTCPGSGLVMVAGDLVAQRRLGYPSRNDKRFMICLLSLEARVQQGHGDDDDGGGRGGRLQQTNLRTAGAGTPGRSLAGSTGCSSPEPTS